MSSPRRADETTRRSLLEAYVRELLVEDARLIASLRGIRSGSAAAEGIVRRWARGRRLDRQHEVVGFVAQRWPAILERFRGDHEAAEQTVHNVLDAKYG